MVEKFEVGKYYKAVKNKTGMLDERREEFQIPRKLISCGIIDMCDGEKVINRVVFEGVNDGDTYNYYCSDLALVKNGKTIKEKPDNMERFMVYGTGCNNKSDLYKTEKEAKEFLKKAVKDSSWTGRNILYKLVPIFEGETSIKVTKFKKVKIK